MTWTFAIINGRLAEVYYRGPADKGKVWGYCYVKKSEFKTEKEQRWLQEDTKHFRFVYRGRKYRRIDQPR